MMSKQRAASGQKDSKGCPWPAACRRLSANTVLHQSLAHIWLLVAAVAVPVSLLAGTAGEPTVLIAAPAPSDDSVPSLTRIGQYVQQYYTRAQSLVSLEQVVIQPLTTDLRADGRARRLEYELHVEWSPSVDNKAPVANVVRTLLTVDGRPARPTDEPGCTDPRPVSPEPLAMLLPKHRDEYIFKAAGTSRSDGRRTLMINYVSSSPAPAEIMWRGRCVSVDLPGRTAGRVWADVESGEVLRLDKRLTESFEVPIPEAQQLRGGVRSLIIEKADSSIRYKSVKFREPDETLLLPASIETVTVIRNAGVPRLRTTQLFSRYRRFVTDARIVAGY